MARVSGERRDGEVFRRISYFLNALVQSRYLSRLCFCLSCILKRRSDWGWSTPRNFTEIFTEPLYFRLFLDEGFDFHGGAALWAL